MPVRIIAEITSLADDDDGVRMAERQLASALRNAKFLSIDIGDVVVDTAMDADPELPEHELWHCDVEVS